MTSLCPGPLFMSPGLNQNSTPTPPTATPSDIDRHLKRQPFNGRDWPRDSPVARVYDIGNSSTSLVLLNKRRKKRSQLRGLTDRGGDIVTPDPERHALEEPSVSWEHHKRCINSSSEPFRPRVNLDLGWVNATQRPPVKFDSGSHVNHRRHTSCRVSSDSPAVDWRGVSRRPLTGTSYGVDSEIRTMTPMLNDPDLSQGERKYLYSIARIYSTSQMKQLKQDQYHQLLFKELAKGYHSPKEYDRYLGYLNTPRKTQFGKLDNYDEQCRSRSAPPPSNSDMNGRGGESERTESRQRKRVPPLTCRSWAPSTMSVSSRMSSVSNRYPRSQKGSKKKPKQRPISEPEPKPVQSQSSEPVSAISTMDEDDTDHIRKDESERPEDALNSIRESEEGSKEKTTEPMTPRTPRKEPASPEKEPTPRPDEGGTSARKGESASPRKSEVLSPRKGEETPRKDDKVDGPPSEGRDERSSEAAGVNNIASSNTTSNNFLALIVSDAEKEESETKTVEGSEQEKQSVDNTSATADANLPRKFSDTKLASGYSPRINKEGRTRPLSRAGRGTEMGTERENSDDDYDDTDEETEKAATGDKQKVKEQSQQEEPVQRSGLEPEQPVVDTSRTDDSKMEERGAMDETNTTSLELDKRAGSPEEAGDERAKDNHEHEGQRSLIIPVTPSEGNNGNQSPQRGEVLDLSVEGRNRDVEKIEY